MVDLVKGGITMAYCTNCGHQLADGAKFCFECGAKVDTSVSSHDIQRRVIYDGEIRKCPNCGNLLDSFELRCKLCGYELRGNTGCSTVQKFADEIKQIEKEGEKGDGQRLITHISTFPIPNSKEELLEFLILSSSKIDADRYKSDTKTIRKEISDAWSSKFEQAYYKALIAFVDEPTITIVQEIYNSKKQEIKRNKRTGFWSNWGFIIGLSLFMIFLFLLGSILEMYS
jgi:hypothetical protein